MQSFIELVMQQSITFFAILDPIGSSAIMLSLLHANITKTEIKKVAYKTTLTIVIAFLVVLVLGNVMLSMFGIDENSLKVIGGIVLILTALKMLSSNKSKKLSKEENDEINEEDDLSVIPIAIPITFGPGMFSTIIILKQQAVSFIDIGAIVLAFLINALLLYIIYKNSLFIRDYLGVTAQNIITKLMGLVVGAIAVQFIISGIVALSLMYLK